MGANIDTFILVVRAGPSSEAALGRSINRLPGVKDVGRLDAEPSHLCEISCDTVRMTNSPNPSRVRSFRCSDEVWESAKRRASGEEVTVSFVLAELLEGYATGALDLPTTHKVWTPFREAEL